MGAAWGEPIWANPSENTMAPLWSFRENRAKSFQGLKSRSQEGPVKGKCALRGSGLAPVSRIEPPAPGCPEALENWEVVTP